MKFEIDPVAFLQELRSKRMFGGMCGCGEYRGGQIEIFEHLEEMLKSHYPEAFENESNNEKRE